MFSAERRGCYVRAHPGESLRIAARLHAASRSADSEEMGKLDAEGVQANVAVEKQAGHGQGGHDSFQTSRGRAGSGPSTKACDCRPFRLSSEKLAAVPHALRNKFSPRILARATVVIHNSPSAAAFGVPPPDWSLRKLQPFFSVWREKQSQWSVGR